MNRTLLVSLLLVGCAKEKPVEPAAQPPPPVPSPSAMLDQLDSRKPVPLLPMMANHQKQNMREHLLGVQEIVTALATDDFAAVEKAVGRIGFSEQMGMMCTHMGAGAPGFTEQALAFHHTATAMPSAVWWKQQLVDDQAWRQATATAPPTPHAMNPVQPGLAPEHP
jgi:hypothetical protein